MAKEKTEGAEVSAQTPSEAAKPSKAFKFKFKLLAGKHYVGMETVYKPGDIIETDENLVEVYGRPKFELVEG